MGSAGSDAARVRIRAMAEEDLDRVVAIAQSLRDAPQWSRPSYVDAITGLDRPLRRVALVAEMRQEVIGFVVVSLVLTEAELESIAVSEEAQKRGVGAELLKTAMGAVIALGAKEMVLEVRESNLAAAALYARAGFEAIGRRPNYYLDPLEDAILLGTRLVEDGKQIPGRE